MAAWWPIAAVAVTEEIAPWLGISISAVRSPMSDARRQLSSALSRERKVARG